MSKKYVASKKYSSFKVDLSLDKKSHKRMSNSFYIEKEEDGEIVKVSMTLRQAMALKNFMNKHLE